MKLSNNDFGYIIKIFENAIIKELEDAKKYLKEKLYSEHIDNILQSDDIISKITKLHAKKSFMQINPKRNLKKRNRRAIRRRVIASIYAKTVIDLIDKLDEFSYTLNQENEHKITVQTAMNAIKYILSISNSKENQYGISLRNAAECYQHIANPCSNFNKDIIESAEYSKRQWRHQLTLAPIGTGKYGAELFDLKKMADFVSSRNRVGVSPIMLLESFDAKKEKA